LKPQITKRDVQNTKLKEQNLELLKTNEELLSDNSTFKSIILDIELNGDSDLKERLAHLGLSAPKEAARVRSTWLIKQSLNQLDEEIQEDDLLAEN
jgi:hypothetical protein